MEAPAELADFELPAQTVRPCQDVLNRLGITIEIPYTRQFDGDELQHVLHVRSFDVPGVDVFACINPNDPLTLRTLEQQLEWFKEQVEIKVPDNKDLMAYLKSRRLNTNKVVKKGMVKGVIKNMQYEVMIGKINAVDTKDGHFENIRRLKLVRAGVLTIVNAPGLVPMDHPKLDHEDWEFAHKDQLGKETAMSRVLLQWHNMFAMVDDYSEAKKSGMSGMLLKAESKFSTGKAYYVRVFSRDEFLFFHFRVDASQKRQQRHVILIFKQRVGRDEGLDKDAGLRLISAKCLAPHECMPRSSKPWCKT